MQVIGWYYGISALHLVGIWLQQRYRIFNKIAEAAWDGILWCWSAMMRHTGDPAYTYKPRRYA